MLPLHFSAADIAAIPEIAHVLGNTEGHFWFVAGLSGTLAAGSLSVVTKRIS